MRISQTRFRTCGRLAALVATALPIASCTQAQLDGGTSSSYLILTSIEAASGATPSEFSGILQSDVITNVKTTIGDEQVLVPTIFEDFGSVTFSLGLKDPGTTNSPTRPSTANFITVDRYRVEYFRADGRNTPGVDVPYGFDGAVTLTVTGPGGGTSFTLVRNQAKSEAPLQALAGGGGAVAISAIARVTFYGHDQTGREVSVTGQISVTFADWGDPTS
jgi:hypothetical protein